MKYEPRFIGVFSRNNIPRIKDGANVINLDDKKRKEAHSVSSFIDRNTAVYFDSFGIEYNPQELLRKPKINLSHTTYLEYKILLCVDFIVSLS